MPGLWSLKFERVGFWGLQGLGCQSFGALRSRVFGFCAVGFGISVVWNFGVCGFRLGQARACWSCKCSRK